MCVQWVGRRGAPKGGAPRRNRATSPGQPAGGSPVRGDARVPGSAAPGVGRDPGVEAGRSATDQSAASSEACGVVRNPPRERAKREPSLHSSGAGHGRHLGAWSGCQGTLRRRGRGTPRGVSWELERPSVAPFCRPRHITWADRSAAARPSPEPLAHGAGTVGITGVEGLTRFQEHYQGLLIGDRAVADPSRDDEQLARSEGNVALVLETDAQPTSSDKEDLVGVLVLVPDELASNLDHLDVVVVDVGDDLRTPIFVEAPELLVEVHPLGHSASSSYLAVLGELSA